MINATDYSWINFYLELQIGDGVIVIGADLVADVAGERRYGLHLIVQIGQFQLQTASFRLLVVFAERALHHVLDAQMLHPQQVEDHGVGDAKLRRQARRLAQHHRVQLGRFRHVHFAQDDDRTRRIEPATTGPSSHLAKH